MTITVKPGPGNGWTDQDGKWWSSQQMIRWAKANGLVPEDVVAATGWTVEDGQIHYHEFDRDPEGRVQIDPDRPPRVEEVHGKRLGIDHVKSTPRTAPLVKPFPNMTATDLLGAFQRMVRKQDSWRGYVGWDPEDPDDGDVEAMLQEAIDAIEARRHEEGTA